MDRLTAYRKSKLLELIKARPYAGNQNAFAEKAKLSKGRISQLLDPDQPFGERSAKAIETNLRLSERYFEGGFESDRPGHGWPFPKIDIARWLRLADWQKNEIQGVVRERLDKFEADSNTPPAAQIMADRVAKLDKSTYGKSAQPKGKGKHAA